MDKKLTFNENPKAYYKYRPGYPDELFNDIFESIVLDKDSYLLDIGAGAGKELIPFIHKNLYIDALDIGKNFIDFIKKKHGNYKKLNTACGEFEKFPEIKSKYDIVFSATAFHWIDKDLKYKKVYNLLKENGVLALTWHIAEPDESNFSKELQDIYAQEIPEMHDDFKDQKMSDLIQERRKEIIESGLFNIVKEKKYDWDMDFDYQTYYGLLNTFSDHIMLKKEVKRKFYKKLEKLFMKFNNKYQKEYHAILFICRKRDGKTV